MCDIIVVYGIRLKVLRLTFTKNDVLYKKGLLSFVIYFKRFFKPKCFKQNLLAIVFNLLSCLRIFILL